MNSRANSRHPKVGTQRQVEPPHTIFDHWAMRIYHSLEDYFYCDKIVEGLKDLSEDEKSA